MPFLSFLYPFPIFLRSHSFPILSRFSVQTMIFYIFEDMSISVTIFLISPIIESATFL